MQGVWALPNYNGIAPTLSDRLRVLAVQPRILGFKESPNLHRQLFQVPYDLISELAPHHLYRPYDPIRTICVLHQ